MAWFKRNAARVFQPPDEIRRALIKAEAEEMGDPQHLNPTVQIASSKDERIRSSEELAADRRGIKRPGSSPMDPTAQGNQRGCRASSGLLGGFYVNLA